MHMLLVHRCCYNQYCLKTHTSQNSLTIFCWAVCLTSFFVETARWQSFYVLWENSFRHSMLLFLLFHLSDSYLALLIGKWSEENAHPSCLAQLTVSSDDIVWISRRAQLRAVHVGICVVFALTSHHCPMFCCVNTVCKENACTHNWREKKNVPTFLYVIMPLGCFDLL